MTQGPGLFPPLRSTAGTSPSSAQHMAGTLRRSPATRGGVPVIAKARPVDRQRAIHRRFPPGPGATYVYTACFQGYFLYPGTTTDLATRFERHRQGDPRRDRQPDELTEMVVMSNALARYQALEAEQYLIGFYRSQGRAVLNRKLLTVGEMRGGREWAGLLSDPRLRIFPRAVIRNPHTRYRDPCPIAWYWPIPRGS
jgi:predicted GIY-YIG superfamily endonuclease